MKNIFLKNDTFINKIQNIGEKVPNVTMIFIYAILLCFIASFLLSFFNIFVLDLNFDAKEIKIINLLSTKQLILFLNKSIQNFLTYPAFGIVLLSSFGIILAQQSGLIDVFLRKMMSFIPKKYLTPCTVFIAILAHIAPSSSVILTPIIASLFYSYKRNPLAGIMCYFAGLSGAFVANFTLIPIDPILQTMSQQASNILDINYNINPLSNYFFSLACAIFTILFCWFLNDKFLEKYLDKFFSLNYDKKEEKKELSCEENKAFNLASLVFLAMLLLLSILIYPKDSLFRAQNGNLMDAKSAFINSIVAFIMIFFGISALIFGFISKKFKSLNDVIKVLENGIKTLAPFILFCFFAGQFIYLFNASNLGKVLAIELAKIINFLNINTFLNIIFLIVFSFLLNLFITSATSKWALMAPIIIPAFMQLNLSAEFAQAAYRIGASANIITPMFSLYPLIIIYCRKYFKDINIATLCFLMLPYSFFMLIIFSLLLFIFYFFNIPLGFEAKYFIKIN